MSTNSQTKDHIMSQRKKLAIVCFLLGVVAFMANGIFREQLWGQSNPQDPFPVWMAIFGSLWIGQTCLVFLGLLYLLPAWIAKRDHHPQTRAIFVLNLLLGWTGIFWVLALVWAYYKPSKS